MAALALAPSALAAYPYTTGTPSADPSTYRLNAGQTPNDITGGSSDWKYAATPESGAPVSITSNDRELNGVRGAHVVDADNSVETAWMTTTGRPDVLIAVLDSGIKWNDAGAMKDLANKVRLNAAELPTPNHAGPALIAGVDCSTYADADDANGDHVFDVRDYACDDRVDLNDSRRAGPPGVLVPQDLLIAFSNGDDADGNGYADDIAGWDFLDNDNDAFDDVQYGHGTGEAEDSVAEADNNQGMPGTCPNCTFMPLRVGDSFVADVNRFAMAAIYATDSGAEVIQEALGTLNNSALGRRAVEYAYDHGTTVIASAADEAAQHHNWPSTYQHTIVVNSVVKYDDTFTPNNSYLQFNGCTNFSTKITVAIPSTSCSSNATGLAAGMAGLVYSAALNHGIEVPDDSPCRRVDGTKCTVTPNEVKQLMASGEIDPMVSGAEAPAALKGTSDDVDFLGAGAACTPVALPGCTDPNRNFPAAATQRPVPSPLIGQTRSYPARTGFDQYYGYGRVNMLKAVKATAEAKIPPEADITSPTWYEQIDPGRANFEVKGSMYARGGSYTCTLEVAPGSEPNNATDFVAVPTAGDVCNGTTARTAPFSGVIANVSVADLKALFPLGTDFGGAAPPPQSNTEPDGGLHQNNRPNVEPFGFTVRLRVEKTAGPTTLTGQDQRNLYLHRDADLIDGWPKQLSSDGASSPALADLDGDNRNELILGTSDGTVHAFRRDGSELPGWPVRGDPLPIHTGAPAYATEVPAGLSRGAMLSSPAVADIDGDGAPEVAIADMEGRVYVWDSAGRLVWKREANPAFSGKPLAPFENVRRGPRYRTQHGFIASPVIADLDSSKDGKLEVIAAGMDRHVYAWHAGGAPVGGWPVVVVDRDKVTGFDATTHAPAFKPASAIGDELNQGAIVDTPAVGDLDGDGRPEVVVGTNEEYPAAQDGGLNTGISTPSGPLLDALQAQIGLGTGNTRLYAIKAAGDPGDPATDNSIFLWRFKPGVLLTELLPVVGEGVTGAPVIAKASCGGNTDPKVGVSAAAGFAYLVGPDGKSCLGQSGGKDNPLAIEFAAGAGKYDTPSLAAVGQGSFGQLDPAGGPAFLTPVVGLIRALDLAVNEYQGGQDFVGAWNTDTGQYRPGFPSPVNDLQFLTGPSIADVGAGPGEEVLGGTASLDLNALSGAGAPAGANWPKFTADWMVTNPVIGSFGADETDAATRQTVIAATRAGTLFAYDTTAPACSAGSWPRFHHDNASSGDYGRDAVSPGKPYAVSASGGQISFKAPGDDLLCGKVDHYQAITSVEEPAADLSGGTSIPAPAPAAPGGAQTLALPAGVRRFVAFRAVDEQGNVGRAVVIDRGGPGGPGGPQGGGGPGGGTPPPSGGCADRSAPRTFLGRRALKRSKRRSRVRGHSGDRGRCPTSVKRIDVMVAKLVRGHRCRFVKPSGRLARVRRCSRVVRLHPRVRAGWTLRIRRRLPRGRYQVTARAVDGAGNHEKRALRNRVRVRLR